MKALTLQDFADKPLVQLASNDGVRGPREFPGVALTQCVLQDKYLKDVTFRHGAIQHCRFEFVNLRNVLFDTIDLTGSRFIACNLEKARFESCKLWFVVFERCEMNYESIMTSLPPENDLRMRLLRVLRLNADSMGNKVWADRILLKELQAEREDLRGAILHATPYYVTHYDSLHRVLAALKLAGHYARFLIWGYGLYLGRLCISAGVLLLSLATLASWDTFAFNVGGAVRGLSWTEALYLSVINLTTVGFGDITPANAAARVLVSATALCGVVVFGFVAAAFYRRLAR